MIEEKICFDYNQGTEQIIHRLSDKLKEGYQIQILMTIPGKVPSQLKSPATAIHSRIASQSNIQAGPSLLLKQPQPSVGETQSLSLESEQPSETKNLDLKLKTCIETYQKENYQMCLVQLQSLLKILEFQITDAKQSFANRKKGYLMMIQVYYYQSQCYKFENRLIEAQERIEYCLKQFVINDQETLSKLTLELALLNMLMHKFNKALDLFSKALKLFEFLNWKPEIAFTLSHIAFIYGIYSCHTESKSIMKEALDIIRSVLPDRDLRVKECQYLMGYVYFLSKDLDHSQEFLEIALPLDQESERTLTIKILNLLAMVQHMKGLDRQSIISYQRAVDLSHERYKGHLLNNLGLVFMEGGNVTKAKATFERAHQLISKGVGLMKSRAKKNINFLLTQVMNIE